MNFTFKHYRACLHQNRDWQTKIAMLPIPSNHNRVLSAASPIIYSVSNFSLGVYKKENKIKYNGISYSKVFFSNNFLLYPSGIIIDFCILHPPPKKRPKSKQ